MVITQIIRVSFNPATEWNQIIKFKTENPDYKLNESTVAYVFEKKTTNAWRVNDSATDNEEPEIFPCRGCTDYDGQGGCKSNGGCGAKMEEDRRRQWRAK